MTDVTDVIDVTDVTRSAPQVWYHLLVSVGTIIVTSILVLVLLTGLAT